MANKFLQGWWPSRSRPDGVPLHARAARMPSGKWRRKSTRYAHKGNCSSDLRSSAPGEEAAGTCLRSPARFPVGASQRSMGRASMTAPGSAREAPRDLSFAIPVRPLSAQLRRSRPRSATSAIRQLRPSAAQQCGDADAGAPLDAGPGYSPSHRLRVSELVRSATGCPPSADAARRLSRGPRSGGRQFDPCPGAEDRVSFGQ